MPFELWLGRGRPVNPYLRGVILPFLSQSKQQVPTGVHNQYRWWLVIHASQALLVYVRYLGLNKLFEPMSIALKSLSHFLNGSEPRLSIPACFTPIGIY